MSTTKTCSLCKEEKNLGEFPRDKSKKGGYSPQCKTCRREYKRQNAAALAETQKKYRNTPASKFSAYKYSAKYRGFKWKLTMKQFLEYWKLPCVWCGVAIETIGLDRIDPTKPYQQGNIEPCCKDCNRMKSDLSSPDFIGHVRKIVDFRRNK